MRIYLENEGDLELDLNYQELAEQVAEAVLDYENCPYEAQVELLLTMNDEIHEMNREFRDTDRATDVLSFPMIEYETPGDFDFLEDDDSCFDPDSGELMLGNIVISKEKVLSQAEEYGHSVKREYAFLIAHSMLHLLGYDHMEEDERAVMEQKQREILDEMGITR
ncbi:MAG: rRNA maturation RNase YbeY [Bariatricus sp.]|nr:rRNA maturation RNase YbeY [Bariatricus sp.]